MTMPSPATRFGLGNVRVVYWVASHGSESRRLTTRGEGLTGYVNSRRGEDDDEHAKEEEEKSCLLFQSIQMMLQT